VYGYFKGGTCGVLIGTRKTAEGAQRFADIFFKRNRQWMTSTSFRLRFR
jgi:hypothetical protein